MPRWRWRRGRPLRPEALRKLCELVSEGATLIGSRPPERSASLENYPDCDQAAAGLIDELWGESGLPAQGDSPAGQRPCHHRPSGLPPSWMK